MHICIITGIFPPDIGGPATYVSHFAQSLHQHGHKVCIITLGDAVAPFPFPVKRVSRKYPLPIRLLLLFGILLRDGWRSDVWYINGLELPAVLAGKLLQKRMIMKVVSDYAWERAVNKELTTDTVHEFQNKKQHWKVGFHKTLRAWLTQQVKMVITPSRYVKKLVCRWGIPDERVQVIYNAVEIISEKVGSKIDARRQLALPESAFLVITVGRLISLKGIDQLIRAIAWLRREQRGNKESYLLIVGDGPEKNRLTEVTETLSVAEHVRFIGQVDRKWVLTYLRASDLFVLNSSTEGFSHVILEAMMVGTPVIATAVGGTPELVVHEKNGILIPHGNFEELKDQIRRILQDISLRERLIEGGMRTVQSFSWDRLFQQTLHVLCNC